MKNKTLEELGMKVLEEDEFYLTYIYTRNHNTPKDKPPLRITFYKKHKAYYSNLIITRVLLEAIRNKMKTLGWY